MDLNKERIAKWLPKLLGILFLLPVAVVLILPGLRAEILTGVEILIERDLEGLRDWAGEFGAWAPLATSCLMVAQALVAPIPAVLVTWVNSLLFGWFAGGCLSIFSATIAASICYWIGRFLGEPLANRLVSTERLAKWKELTDNHGPSTILGARLLPFVPFDPISYIAGIVNMRFLPFFVMTLIGQIPAGFAYSYLGVQITEPKKLVVTGVCTVIGLLTFGMLVRRALSRKHQSG
ncbi:MAG: TVP38/TMEM64 family protein [Verrucomicrobiota bacterium]